MTIANFILAKIGLENKFAVMVAIAVISMILTYGGISLFVVMFALVPLARPIFKKIDINWELLPIPLFFGMATITMSMIPGTPSVQNAIPANALGTPLTAAPVTSLITTAVVSIAGLLYMRVALQRSLDRGEGFYTYLEGEGTESLSQEGQPDLEAAQARPGIFLSVLPILSLIAVILIFSQVDHIILIALSLAIVISALLYRPYLKDQVEVMSLGANGAVPSAFATSSSVAFGTVLTTAPSFAIIQ